MALKDWKKTHSTIKEIRFRHKKKPFGFIRIIKHGKLVSPEFLINKWSVTYEYISVDSEREIEIPIRTVRTKVQALKFAKSYMRKH